MKKREFRTLICAMLLGDGFISTRDNHFGFGHAWRCRDYAAWKVELINQIFREKNLPRRCKVHKLKHTVKGRDHFAIHVNLYWKAYLSRLHRRIYKPKKQVQYLLSQVSDPLHLAIWFMDDGSEERRKTTRKDGSEYVCNPYLRLHTYGFTAGEQNLICEWFEFHFHVKTKQVHTAKGVYLRWTVADSSKLFRLIKSHIVVPTMREKFRLCLERY